MAKSYIERAPHPENPYVQIARKTLQDNRLSWEARGMLAYLLSKPNNWRVLVADLSKISGRDRTHRIMMELQALHYLTKSPRQNEKGQMQGWDWYVHEIPDLLEIRNTDDSDNGESSPTYNRESTDQREEQNKDSFPTANAIGETENKTKDEESAEDAQSYSLKESGTDSTDQVPPPILPLVSAVAGVAAASVGTAGKVVRPKVDKPPRKSSIVKPLNDAIAELIQQIDPKLAGKPTGVLSQAVASVWRRHLGLEDGAKLTADQYLDIAATIPIFVHELTKVNQPLKFVQNVTSLESWYAKLLPFVLNVSKAAQTTLPHDANHPSDCLCNGTGWINVFSESKDAQPRLARPDDRETFPRGVASVVQCSQYRKRQS